MTSCIKPSVNPNAGVFVLLTDVSSKSNPNTSLSLPALFDRVPSEDRPGDRRGCVEVSVLVVSWLVSDILVLMHEFLRVLDREASRNKTPSTSKHSLSNELARANKVKICCETVGVSDTDTSLLALRLSSVVLTRLMLSLNSPNGRGDGRLNFVSGSFGRGAVGVASLSSENCGRIVQGDTSPGVGTVTLSASCALDNRLVGDERGKVANEPPSSRLPILDMFTCA